MDYPGRIVNRKGFTLMEVLMALVVLGIATAIAIPSFTAWLPDARLKSAARDIFSNLQLTKMEAIKANSNYTIRFDAAAGTYQMENGSGVVQRTITLSDYGSGVRFGSAAASAVSGDPVALGPDYISYTDNKNVFNSRGTGNDENGYVYLTNSKGTSYAVGSRASGAVVLLKWDGGNWT